MILPKSCPKCGGDMGDEEVENHQVELVCIQCGFRQDAKKEDGKS